MRMRMSNSPEVGWFPSLILRDVIQASHGSLCARDARVDTGVREYMCKYMCVYE